MGVVYSSGVAVQSYRDLVAWQRGVQLVTKVYSATRDWPREEMYGLTAQVRRAAVSIPANVAEGQGRATTRDFIRHLSIAYGSLLEVETHLLISGELGYLSNAPLEALLAQTAELGRILNGLSQSLRAKTDPR